jgi:hypothetical protein
MMSPQQVCLAAGFEPQIASSFMKKVKASPNTQISRPSSNGDSSLVLPFKLLVVLASSTSGDQQSLHCADHHPIKI